MFNRITRFVLYMAPVLFVSVLLVGLGTSKSAAQGGESLCVTGCLQKGVESGGYFINADDGKVWELSSKSVKLGEHVGHKVTLTGSQVHHSQAFEKKMAKSETSEASGKEFADMHVTGLKMVSDTCQ